MNKINLTDDDVVTVSTDQAFVEDKGTTATGAELMNAIRGWIYNSSRLDEDGSADWAQRGVECKVLLATGGGWQKGKVRLRLEFMPDPVVPKLPVATNSDLPLNDLRSHLNM